MSKQFKIITALLIFVLMLGLCACQSRTGPKEEKQKGARENWEVSENPDSESSSSKEPESEPESEPEKDLRPVSLAEDFLNAAKTGERYAIQDYVNYNALFGLREGQDADWILKQILMRMRYEILSSEIEDDKAVISVKFTNVDMNIVLPLYYSEAMLLEYNNAISDAPMEQSQLDKEYERIFASLMLKNEAAKVEKLVEVEAGKIDDIWKLTINSTLGNAMLGGYIDAQKAPLVSAPQIEIPKTEVQAEQEAVEHSQEDTDSGEAIIFDDDFAEND